MQKIRISTNSFQFGEVSDSIQMRTDSPVYPASARQLENMIVMAEGSVKKRFGLKWLYDYGLTYNATYPAQSHLFEFSFSDDEQYLVSVEHEKVRCFYLDQANNQVTLVSTITQDTNNDALPFDQEYLQQYTTAQYGDVMFICHPLFMPRMLIRTGLTSFEITPFTFDRAINNLITYQPYSSLQPHGYRLRAEDTGNNTCDITVWASVTPQYSQSGISGTTYIVFSANQSIDISQLNFLDVNGHVNLTYGAKIGFRIGTWPSNPTQAIIRIVGTDFAGDAATEDLTLDNTQSYFYTATFFKTIESITEINGGTITAQIGYDDYGKTTFFEASHAGSYVRVDEEDIPIISVSGSQVTGGTNGEVSKRLSVLNPLRASDGSSNIEVTEIGHTRQAGDIIYVEDATTLGGINVSQINGQRTVAGVTDENTWYFSAGATANTSEDGGGYVTIRGQVSTLDWGEQSFSSRNGYPAAVSFHQNRLCFGGTITQPDAIWMSKIGNFFNFYVGEGLDDDAIAIIAATGTVNEIRFLVSNRDLQVFGANAELYIPTFLNQSITPTNVQIRVQTPYGSEFTTPVSIDGATIFVQNGGNVVREYLYTDTEDAYTSTAVSTISSHLIKSPKCMTVSHGAFNGPESYAFMSNSDGDIALFNSNRAEKRAAWTRITTDGNFCSVCGITERVFANVWTPDGRLVLCEFDGEIGLDRYITGTVSANYLDVSAEYSVGDEVSVVSEDGLTYYGDFTVVDNGGTASVLLTGITGTVHAGIKFTARIQSNPIDASGPAGPITGEIRGIGTVVIDLRNTRSAKVNSRNIVLDSSFSGKKEVRLLGYSRDPVVVVEQNEPLPLQVNGFISEVVV